jgi:hypothetical protein
VLTATVIPMFVPYEGAVSVQSRIMRSRTPPDQDPPLASTCEPTVRDALTAPAQLDVIDCQGFDASLGCHINFEMDLPDPSVAELAQISTVVVCVVLAAPPASETVNVTVGPSMYPAT